MKDFKKENIEKRKKAEQEKQNMKIGSAMGQIATGILAASAIYASKEEQTADDNANNESLLAESVLMSGENIPFEYNNTSANEHEEETETDVEGNTPGDDSIPFEEDSPEDNSEKTSEELLKEEVDKQLENVDFDNLEEFFNDENFSITDETCFKEIVTNLINGSFKSDPMTILGKIANSFFHNTKSILPILLMIIAIAILGNIVNSFKANSNSQAIADLIHFVCMAVVIVLLVSMFKNVYTITTGCVNKISSQMSIIFPILMTLLTTMGSVMTVGIYQPIVAVLTSGMTAIFSKVIYPIFLLSLIFIILNNLSNNIKLNKFISFLGSSFKWIVGFIFTIFAGILTIQGISAGKYDTISLKATRFAMKSYIPIIGGYLSDGLDYVMLSSVLIKNAIGVAGLVLLIMSILIPIINILIVKLGLQLVAGIIEPMGNSKISGLCEDLSKVLVYPIVVILAMSFMYFLTIGLIMCTISGV